MKNTISSLFVMVALLFAGLGCGSINPFGGQQSSNTASNRASNTADNKTLTDHAVETAVGESKIGVPECDEVVDMLTTYANDPNDNFIVKAGKSLIVNKIKDAIKTSVEENQTDKAQLAKDCSELKTELEKAMKEQQENSNQ